MSAKAPSLAITYARQPRLRDEPNQVLAGIVFRVATLAEGGERVPEDHRVRVHGDQQAARALPIRPVRQSVTPITAFSAPQQRRPPSVQASIFSLNSRGLPAAALSRYRWKAGNCAFVVPPELSGRSHSLGARARRPLLSVVPCTPPPYPSATRPTPSVFPSSLA